MVVTETGTRFAEERRRLGYTQRDLVRTGAVTAHQLKTIERYGGPLDDAAAARQLARLGMDLRYVWWGDRTNPQAIF